MNTQKLSVLFVLSLISTVVPGCDSSDDYGSRDSPRAQVLAVAGLSEQEAEAIEAEDNPDVVSAAPHPSSAGEGWRRVCAQNLTLKSAPGGGGGSLGTLYNGWWFYKTGTDGAWSVGYSHELATWGWVLSEYLC